VQDATGKITSAARTRPNPPTGRPQCAAPRRVPRWVGRCEDAGVPSARHALDEALARLSDHEAETRAVCTLNPRAPAQADILDHEWEAGRVRSNLHGVPVVIKDNIDTAALLTTAGSLALANKPPPADAPLVRRIRDAGMVIVGKSNLSEWANIRDPGSTSGWSGFGGLTRNPYGLNRSAGGSSSGSGAAVGARYVPMAVGTETDGSITCPAAFNGCVGIKPTVGLLPGTGIVPISASQDTAGPMALSVRDAAAFLSVLAADGIDYSGHAVGESLVGLRIGVPREMFWGYSSAADEAAEAALAALARAGAVIVDNTDLPTFDESVSDAELLVLLAELRDGMASYLPTRGPEGPQNLRDIVAFNVEHADVELQYFGQQFFEQALEGPDVTSAEYAAARRECLKHGRDGIDAVLKRHQLDALVTPSYAPAVPIDLVNPEHHPGSCTQPAAMAGYPLVTVPSGLVLGLPVAISFWGTAASERTLIRIAHAYEVARTAATGPFPAPTFPGFV
jgi:amidase